MAVSGLEHMRAAMHNMTGISNVVVARGYCMQRFSGATRTSHQLDETMNLVVPDTLMLPKLFPSDSWRPCACGMQAIRHLDPRARIQADAS